MRRKKYKFLLCFTALSQLFSLSSCVLIVKPLKFKVLAPYGAQTLAFGHWYTDYENFHVFHPTNKDTKSGFSPLTNMTDAFDDGSIYDAIIYDVKDGLELITNENKPYKLARVVSTGNMFLLNTKNYYEKYSDMEEKPTLSTDRKVAYYSYSKYDEDANDNAIREYILKAYSGKITEKNLFRIPDPLTAVNILLSDKGSFEGNIEFNSVNDIDFVFVENTFAYQAISTALKESENGNIKTVDYYNEGKTDGRYYSEVNSSLRYQLKQKYVNIYNIPEYGLFISNKLETKEYKDIVENFLEALDGRYLALTTATAHLTDPMFMFGDDKKQYERLGSNTQYVSQVQNSTYFPNKKDIDYNMMGFVSKSSGSYNLECPNLNFVFKELFDENPFANYEESSYMSTYYAYPKEK